jgi:hypothetical protein
MTSARDTPRPRSTNRRAVTDGRHLEPVEVDATVVPVGTFAAGQSVDGRYVAVTAAPQGDFAEGQAEEDEAIRPEAAEASAPKQPGAPTEPSGARR